MTITIELLKQTAQDRGGKCLSSKYLGYTTKHKWECSKGHQWHGRPQEIQRGKWCPKCAGKNRTIGDLHKLAKERGFECLSNEFTRMGDQYEWRCKSGHTWTTTGTHIKSGTGCPHCNQFISEAKCRFVFESMLGKKFPKTRRALQCQLELDGYCNELKLAFEFQGIQHFSTKCFTNDQNKLKLQRQNDRKKTRICNKLGIQKIDVHWEAAKTTSSLERYVKASLAKLGISKVHEVNWDEFDKGKTALEEIYEIAEQRGFRCLSTLYWHSQSKLDFECKCGWQWSATPARIKQGTGCPRCNKNPRYSLDDLKAMGSKIGLALQSQTYRGITHKYKWECNKDHIWHASGVSVMRAQKCRYC